MRWPFYFLVLCVVALMPDVVLAADAAADSVAAEKPNTFTLDAQLYFRGEIRRGGMVKSDDEENTPKDYASFINSRTRLNLGYERGVASMKISVQHTGVWGQSNKGAVNLYEAWAMFKARNGLFAKIGRQALSYDDERIIGKNDWTMAASSHDVLKVGYYSPNTEHRVEAFAGFNQNGINTAGGTFYKNGAYPYKNIFTLWYHYAPRRVPIGASLLFMNVGMQDGDSLVYTTQYQQLAGTYLSFKPKNLRAEASFYYQFGHNEQGMPIRAWMAAVRGEYDFNQQWTAYTGYDHLSGDKYFAVPPQGSIGLIRHDVVRGFNAVYGSHHKFYGAMDFFYLSAYVGGFSPGLQSGYWGVQWNPWNINIDLSYHLMATTAPITNHNRLLGHELEFELDWNITKDMTLSLGYSFMRGTDTLKALKRASSDGRLHWAWLSFTYSPQFIKVKW